MMGIDSMICAPGSRPGHRALAGVPGYPGPCSRVGIPMLRVHPGMHTRVPGSKITAAVRPSGARLTVSSSLQEEDTKTNVE
eukprot:1635186-Rhodomonas_salina.1